MPDRKSKQQQDLIGNRIALYMTLGFICFIVLMQYNRMLETLQGIQKYPGAVIKLIWATAAIFLVSFIYLLINVKRLKSFKDKVFNPLSLFIWGLASFLGSVCMYFYYLNAIKAMYVLLIFFFVAYIIHSVYENDFFLLTIMIGVSIISFYVLSRICDNPPFIPYIPLVSAAMLAITVVAAVLTFICKKNDGTLVLGSFKLNVFQRDASYLPIFVFYLLILVAAVLLIPFKTVLAYYATLGLGIFGLISAIYYTIKLMYN